MPFLQKSKLKNLRAHNAKIIDDLFKTSPGDYREFINEKYVITIDAEGNTQEYTYSGVADTSVVRDALCDTLNKLNIELIQDGLRESSGKKALYEFFKLLRGAAKYQWLMANDSDQNIKTGAENANTIVTKRIRDIISQQTEEPVFHAVDVPGDGNCYYNAILMSLMDLCLTGAVTPDSNIAEKLLEPNGLFAKIQIKIKRLLKGQETFEFSGDAAARVTQLLELNTDKYYLLENIMVPALREVIVDYFDANKAALLKHSKLKSKIAHDLIGLGRDNIEIFSDLKYITQDGKKEWIATDEGVEYHFAIVRNNIIKEREEGGEIESIILRQLYDVNIESFYLKATKEPAAKNDKPRIFIFNTGTGASGHFYFGLLRSSDSAIASSHQKVMEFTRQTRGESTKAFADFLPVDYRNICAIVLSLLDQPAREGENAYPEVEQIFSVFQGIRNEKEKIQCKNFLPKKIYNTLIDQASKQQGYQALVLAATQAKDNLENLKKEPQVSPQKVSSSSSPNKPAASPVSPPPPVSTDVATNNNVDDSRISTTVATNNADITDPYAGKASPQELSSLSPNESAAPSVSPSPVSADATTNANNANITDSRARQTSPQKPSSSSSSKSIVSLPVTTPSTQTDNIKRSSLISQRVQVPLKKDPTLSQHLDFPLRQNITNVITEYRQYPEGTLKRNKSIFLRNLLVALNNPSNTTLEGAIIKVKEGMHQYSQWSDKIVERGWRSSTVFDLLAKLREKLGNIDLSRRGSSHVSVAQRGTMFGNSLKPSSGATSGNRLTRK